MASLGVVVDWVLLDKSATALQVGDLVSADAGGMPTYRVVGLEEGRARLNDGLHERDWVLPLSSLRWKAAI